MWGMTQPSVNPQTPVPTGKANARLRQSVGDMVRSLAVVFVVVGAILLVTLRPHPDAIKVIDPAPALAQAVAGASFTVLYPSGRSADWKPTSARFEPTAASAPDPVWYLGMITPAGTFIALSQSATTRAGYIPEQTVEGRPNGTDTVKGIEWQKYETKDQRSLVLISPSVTTIVSGSADWPTLEEYAGSLLPVTK